MKILFFEAFFDGHHTVYVRVILPRLAGLARLGHDVIISISRNHFETPMMQESAQEFGEIVDSDSTLPTLSAVITLRVRHQIAKLLKETIDRHSSDHLIATSADPEASYLALARLRSWNPFRSLKSATTLMHNSEGDCARNWTERMKDVFHQVGWM